MDFISEHIFAYLDCQSLINAAAASPVWNQVILDGNMWQILHEQKVRE